MMLGHKPSLAIVCGLAACHKLSAPSCLILEYLGVCHMVACHNPSQTVVCCLAACRNPSAPRVCRMAACCNPSAPRVCRLAACHFPPPKLEVGTQLCRLDACHFPPYQRHLTLLPKVCSLSWCPQSLGQGCSLRLYSGKPMVVERVFQTSPIIIVVRKANH